ncbi:unnamed protein product [Pleuronectes platessa]|uniref:Uncharacterized protein n=1 Tax=Pleuronectes platessa TaxID=8262 RepID=A0A9N7YRQ4_PLEPL|nr:unnamed protein product [Pleuronectes platessa]
MAWLLNLQKGVRAAGVSQLQAAGPVPSPGWEPGRDNEWCGGAAPVHTHGRKPKQNSSGNSAPRNPLEELPQQPETQSNDGEPRRQALQGFGLRAGLILDKDESEKKRKDLKDVLSRGQKLGRSQDRSSQLRPVPVYRRHNHCSHSDDYTTREDGLQLFEEDLKLETETETWSFWTRRLRETSETQAVKQRLLHCSGRFLKSCSASEELRERQREGCKGANVLPVLVTDWFVDVLPDERWELVSFHTISNSEEVRAPQRLSCRSRIYIQADWTSPPPPGSAGAWLFPEEELPLLSAEILSSVKQLRRLIQTCCSAPASLHLGQKKRRKRKKEKKRKKRKKKQQSSV